MPDSGNSAAASKKVDLDRHAKDIKAKDLPGACEVIRDFWEEYRPVAGKLSAGALAQLNVSPQVAAVLALREALK